MGTELREVALQKGYLKANDLCTSYGPAQVQGDSILDMPQLSKDELKGLARVFSFYVGMPESRFDEIRVAEGFDPEGENVFNRLHEEFNLAYSETPASESQGEVLNLNAHKEERKSGHKFSDLH